MVDHEVHPIPGEDVPTPHHRRQGKRNRSSFFLLFKVVQVLDDVGEDLVQVGDHLGVVGIAVFQPGDRMAGRRPDHALLQLA